MRVLHWAGPSNSGKTRLIEALLPLLPPAHVLKWSHHRLPADRPGSDTERFTAKASSTLLAAQDGLVWRHSPLDRAEIYVWLAESLPEDALLLVEGDKSALQPKIWVGETSPPMDAPVCLMIGPKRPERSVDWFEASVPLADDAIEALTQRLAKDWMKYSYTIRGRMP